MPETFTELVTIGAAASLSDAVHLRAMRLFAIQTPSGWDAADITLQASYDGTTYANVYDELDAEVTIQASASRFILLDPAKYMGVQRVKFRSGTSGAAVAQADAVVLAVILVA